MGARALYGLGRSEEGRDVILKLLAEEDPPVEAAVEYARREGVATPVNAIRYLGVALKGDSTNAKVVEALVTIQLRLRNPKAAIDLLNKAINSGRAKPATLLLRARVLTKAGDLDRAEADALRAFEADPSLPGGVELLYAIYRAQGRLDEARASFEEAEAAGVLHSGARLLLGRIYSRQGDVQQAREMLERVLRDDPTAVGAKNDLAYLLANNDTDLDRAMKLAEDAQRELLKSPNTADTLGFVYLHKGLHEAALHQFRYALQLNDQQPSDLAPTLHYHLGLTLHALERNDEAVAAFEKALALDSDFPEAGDARRKLEKAQRSPDGSMSTS
jgi:tetratricopeptide (TPR) repeat protein